MSIAKYGNPELVGQFTLAAGLVLPVYAFLNMQLRVVYITGRYGAYPFGNYLGLRFLTTFVAVLFCAAGAQLFFDLQEIFSIVMGYSLVKGFQAVADIYYAPVQKEERINLMSFSMIAKSTGSFLGVMIAMMAWGDLLYAILVMLLWEGAFTFVVDKKFAELFCTVDFILEKKVIANLIRESFPVGIATGLTMVNGSIPRFIVEHFMSIQDAGYFGAIQYFFIASSMVIVAVNTSSIPRLANFFQQRDKSGFYRLIFRLIGFGIIVGFSVIIFFSICGKSLLQIFYASDYGNYSNQLQVIIVACVIQIPCAIIAGSILSLGKYWHMVIVLIFAVIVSFFAGIILVNKLGIAGAAYAMVFSSSAQLVLASYFLYRSYKYTWSGSISPVRE